MWHKVKRIVIFYLAVNCVSAEDTEAEKLFRELEVVPDILDEPPKELLKIEYDGGLDVGRGEEFTPTQTKDEPKLDWTAEPDAFYTIIMTNPDIPTRQNPATREWLHWLVVNIPGTDLAKGFVLDPYIGPLNPKESGLVRNVFLVFKQLDKREFGEPILNNTSVAGHERFSSKGFAKKYGMELVAGNIFQSRWDEYVTLLHKQFGITK
ncbi:putative odorant-binding protein A5 [Bactrocera neohumeralis]|uniref:putative odorant-binding protein A5 n=1 Tax=Bactrocera neohumeralis TaxID=98809 RepID=UPI00216670A7|nr:putative odorant-binding protein A5 [Bactrocera neohumeralis]